MPQSAGGTDRAGLRCRADETAPAMNASAGYASRACGTVPPATTAHNAGARPDICDRSLLAASPPTAATPCATHRADSERRYPPRARPHSGLQAISMLWPIGEPESTMTARMAPSVLDLRADLLSSCWKIRGSGQGRNDP